VPLYSPNNVNTIDPFGLIKKNPGEIANPITAIGNTSGNNLNINNAIAPKSSAASTKSIRYPLEGLMVFS
jgi:hypothetical protein